MPMFYTYLDGIGPMDLKDLPIQPFLILLQDQDLDLFLMDLDLDQNLDLFSSKKFPQNGFGTVGTRLLFQPGSDLVI